MYVARSARGRGAGRLVLDALCSAYADRGFWKIVSRIFPENVASIALHERCGFRVVGVYRRHAATTGLARLRHRRRLSTPLSGRCSSLHIVAVRGRQEPPRPCIERGYVSSPAPPDAWSQRGGMAYEFRALSPGQSGADLKKRIYSSPAEAMAEMPPHERLRHTRARPRRLRADDLRRLIERAPRRRRSVKQSPTTTTRSSPATSVADAVHQTAVRLTQLTIGARRSRIPKARGAPAPSQIPERVHRRGPAAWRPNRSRARGRSARRGGSGRAASTHRLSMGDNHLRDQFWSHRLTAPRLYGAVSTTYAFGFDG